MNQMSPRPQMRLPMQSAPIARMPSSATLNGGAGMEPSWDFFDDVLGPVIRTAGPGIVSGLAGMI